MANNAGGVIDAIDVTRDSVTHEVNGFSGSATLFATAPNIDGGLAYGPGGVLFYTAFPTNQIGEIKPGSTSADKIVTAPAAPSVGTLQFFGGNIVVGSYSDGTFCTASVTPDGSGTYDISDCTNGPVPTGGGPEGLIYVPSGSPDFSGPSALVSLYGSGKVGAYSVDSNGLPIPGTEQDFFPGLGGAEGAAIDPVTGDFLFSTFGGGNSVFEVHGFASPATTPEPATFALFGACLAGLALVRRRRA